MSSRFCDIHKQPFSPIAPCPDCFVELKAKVKSLQIEFESSEKVAWGNFNTLQDVTGYIVDNDLWGDEDILGNTASQNIINAIQMQLDKVKSLNEESQLFKDGQNDAWDEVKKQKDLVNIYTTKLKSTTKLLGMSMEKADELEVQNKSLKRRNLKTTSLIKELHKVALLLLKEVTVLKGSKGEVTLDQIGAMMKELRDVQ